MAGAERAAHVIIILFVDVVRCILVIAVFYMVCLNV